MIHYNMRYRGPHEYEKFILNILQYANEANVFLDDLEKEQEYETVKALYTEINDLFNKSTGAFGSSEKSYKRLIMFKEAK